MGVFFVFAIRHIYRDIHFWLRYIMKLSRYRKDRDMHAKTVGNSTESYYIRNSFCLIQTYDTENNGNNTLNTKTRVYFICNSNRL